MSTRYRSGPLARTLPGSAAAILLAFIWAGISAASAQRGAEPKGRTTPPTGSEIAAASKAAQLDVGNVGTATIAGKAFKMTPVTKASQPANEDDGRGRFAGVLENGAPGDETGLPAGKYNLFVANVSGQWRVFAEANGQIVREGRRTTRTTSNGPSEKPQFREKGWCVSWVVFDVLTFQRYVYWTCW